MSNEKSQFNVSALEEKVLKLWEERGIFQKSLEKNKHSKMFVFYEGPPTANAAPGFHHVGARVFKDIIARYKTMRGFFVPRRAGWDTHGLPVEIQIEKELGFKTKRDIEHYGIARFNEKAKASVWRYKEEWEKLTKRIGFWLDFTNPYITYDARYMESLWFIIKRIWDKRLLVEDFRITPWCPRCETGLSTHELGQPGAYKTLKENSIYAKFKIAGRADEYLLVWTTTPWTLPANVAVAVNPKLEYTKYKIKNEYIWSATLPPHESGEPVEIVEKISGKKLVDISYEPLFQVPAEYSLGVEAPYKTIAADFVSVDEGTGMVHIAPAFGEDDMNTIKSQFSNFNFQKKAEIHHTSKISNQKLPYPIIHTVNPNGTMKKGLPGSEKFVKDADHDIIADLEKRGALYKIMPHEHEYPHCWRCDAPVLYFAKNAWWVRTTVIKKKLIANNKKVNWVPAHIKEGRFGEFLRDLRDWAFSRERFWGTPLPIWHCASCGHREVVEGREDLVRRKAPPRNTYYIMRHGESTSYVQHISTPSFDRKYHLTLKGRGQVGRMAKQLRKKEIDVLYSSDVLRCEETADIVARTLGIKKVYYDTRLREFNSGIFVGQDPDAYHQFYSSMIEKFTKPPPEGETLSELRKRVFSFFEDIEKKHEGKTVLIIGHEYPLWMLYAGAAGLTNEEAIALRIGKREKDFIHLAEVMPLSYRCLPRDETGEVNLHRPYVDGFLLTCPKCRRPMRRVSEVADVWFDSGAMPFAQHYFPFVYRHGQNAERNNVWRAMRGVPYPADYICEGIDQTRGWFYTLLAVGTLLGRGPAYQNVISFGLVLDKNGQKMSKSKGNVVDPLAMAQKYGADTLRWYFYTINAPGEPKRFDEHDLFNKLRGFIHTLWNCWTFFDTYVEKVKDQEARNRRLHILDQWIYAKLNILVRDVTKKLDGYDITGAARGIEEFVINDFSQWFLRRSRGRFQHPRSVKEKNEAAATTAHVIEILVKLLAPFIPFVAEALWQELKKKVILKEESVHLAAWPREKRMTKDKKLLDAMKMVRNLVGEALKLRADAGIKVRQPLATLLVANRQILRHPELGNLIQEEVNVKEIIYGDEFRLDTRLTPALKEEGMAREIVRTIQEMRKDIGLKPKDKIRVQFAGTSDSESFFERWKEFIATHVGAERIVFGGKKIFRAECEVPFDQGHLWIGIS